ncbi:Hypp2214 [Branchiostoma lanceolatum]|uniref:Hypp2214 protein n=1 Tax=Branchiostoma lanceolatum TaxID=7740 RepID=A0A8K0ESF0_BRALA|nr:Hypp2214 [Branchiostoma lanceolatum]
MRKNPAYVTCKLVNRTSGPLDLMAWRQRSIVRIYNNVTLTPGNLGDSKLLYSKDIIKNTEPVERMQLLLTELRVFKNVMEEIRRHLRRNGKAVPRIVYRKLYQQVEAMDTYGDIAKRLVIKFFKMESFF